MTISITAQTRFYTLPPIEAFLLAFSFLLVVPTSVATASEVQLPTCRYSVIFPGEPRFEEHSAHFENGFIKWYAATEQTGTALLRHECMCIKGMNRDRMSEVFLRQRLSEFAASTGLSNVGFTSMPFRDGIATTMRGYKNIQGVPTTYEATTFITDDCYLDMVVGSRSAGFPPPESSDFRKSLKLNGHADTGPPGARWVPFQRTPTNAVRSIDVSHMSVRGAIITYLQRFQTSSGSQIVLSKNQLHCATGYGRTEEVLFFAADGVLLNGIQYSPSESPFAPVPNDPSVSVLRPLLCDGQAPAKPDEIRVRLRAAGLDQK